MASQTHVRFQGAIKSDEMASAPSVMARPACFGRRLDRKIVERAMGGKMPPEVDQALVITAYQTKILGEGTRGNPHQIKRFLNSMMLRHAIAEARGFGADIQRPVLAKIMLAVRFYPNFYEQIARLASDHPDGKPEALGPFEEHVRSPLRRTMTTPARASAKVRAPYLFLSLPKQRNRSNEGRARYAAHKP
jgi:hypothetical protein